MSMRITIQVVCETPEDAKDAINRLTRPRTWEDDADARRDRVGPSESRIDAIMNGSGAAAPVASGKDYSKEEPERQNVSPGEPTISKIGAVAKHEVLAFLQLNVQPAVKFSEHCKLLWSRGEIKFDGKDYYL